MARRIFLAYVILTTCLVSGQSPRYVLKGQKVILKKDITGRPDNILWTHNGNKVVEFNGREEYVYDPYKTRVSLDWSSAELNISELRLEDSGKYELEVFVNQKLEKSDYDVEIVDRVAKPTISCNISNSDNSGTLVCSAEPRQPVHLMTFEWHSQGSVHPGPHLQISLGGKLDNQVYSCMVRNPLTTETAAFTAKDCHTPKSSSVALSVTAVVISLLLLVLIAGVYYYCHQKRKGCFAHDSQQGVKLTDRSKEPHQQPVPAPRKKKELKEGSGRTKGKLETKPLLPKTQDMGTSKHYSVQQLNRSADEEKQHGAGDPGLSDESAGSSEDVGPVVNSPADIPQGLVKKRSKIFEPIISPVIEKQMAKQHEPPIPALQEKESKRASDNNQHLPSDDSSVHEDSNRKQLEKPTEEEKQQDAGSDKNQHQSSDDSSVDEDSDGQQLEEPTEEETQSTHDPEPNDESTEESKDMSSERKCSTASDGSDSANVHL
ncbi:uncharacterized protein V6R79_019098 [Siganus canaliculatus]